MQPVKLTVCGTEVELPFKPYHTQIAIIQRVVRCVAHSQSALIESATGTGKTLALLCASLAAQRRLRHKSASPSPPPSDTAQTPASAVSPRAEEDEEDKADEAAVSTNSSGKVFYGTRTHSQVAQVLSELRRTPYKIRSAVLASREHLCTNPSCRGGNGTGGTLPSKDAECKKLLAAKACPFAERGERVGKNLFAPPLSESLHDGCGWDVEDLVGLCRQQSACAYYAARTAAESADLVVAPYNYLLDFRIREALAVTLRGAVVIIDEAHNVADALMQAASCDVDPIVLQDDAIPSLRAIAADDSLAEFIPASKFHDSEAEPAPINLQRAGKLLLPVAEGLTRWATETAGTLHETDFERRANVWNGEIAISVLAAAGITKESLPTLNEVLGQLAEIEMFDSRPAVYSTTSKQKSRYRKRQRYFESSSSDSSASAKSSFSGNARRTLDSVFSVARVALSHKQKYAADYRLVLERTTRGEGWGYSMGFWCLSPAAAFHSIGHKARSVILASGTLAPLDQLALELGADFHERAELGHVADARRQVFASAIVGSDIELTYAHTEEFAVQDAVANAIATVCQSVPAGVLCFFPSHAMLATMLRRWRSTGVLDRSIAAAKGCRLFIEERGASADAFAQTLAQYRAASPHGAVLFAVCRGRASEGVDFADDQARAVIVVGIPYPNVRDLRVTLKREREDTANRGAGTAWYVAQGIRAANQAIGRVIRHRFDYGAVILLDSRYSKPDIVALLPRWLRQSLTNVQTANELGPKLVSFMADAASFVSQAREAAGLPPLPTESLQQPPPAPAAAAIATTPAAQLLSLVKKSSF